MGFASLFGFAANLFHLCPWHPHRPYSGPIRIRQQSARNKVAAADLEAIKILKGISPVAWRNINLIGNFDFTTSSTPVDIEALAARYQNQDFWHCSMTEAEGDGPPV